ncbi:calcium-binding protein 39 [Puma concolor]|uniref:Calcium-binding protein 39 n=1 Tax=Puma concolor TaxID=9696 RepID=A0A6P6IEK0_PUMCO|nr:calcium-binding protein 39 [Puma concolor]
MPFPFGKSHKSPADIVKNLKESMAVLEKQDISDKKAEKATEEVSKNLVAMKEILYGTNEKEPQTEAVAQLAQELYNSGLLSTLVADLQLIDFEGKKDVAQIFNNILRRQIGTRTPTVEYICTQQNILFMLLKGYESPEIALNCGIMLRECIRHEPLAKIILWSEQFYDFFRYVEMSTFDIASDAFATFKDLLTRHKLLSAEFLEQHYDKFFSEYEKLLHSENYVTKRQSLKLLGELLLDRHNFTIMTKYISKPENLKLMMNLLRDKSRNIQFEAFHVFKHLGLRFGGDEVGAADKAVGGASGPAQGKLPDEAAPQPVSSPSSLTMSFPRLRSSGVGHHSSSAESYIPTGDHTARL